ncbi:hypothetical protein OMP43_09360 [Sphingomonas sp. CBMAI 2297]|uniref:hypothetical protein n=1 Tax=Sphingomonas sp. CBMAI 2297 TaxID=2991720 RepID=UPI00245558AB|nr:hypothetical protein [Sphingomonas sp. CBMAI 2297]MDH4744222.1 hypothetical protein [Sphingomonas sp. CBMAI 2297]
MDYFEQKLSFVDGCVMTYSKATRLMTEVWEAEMGAPMGKLSGSPKDRFREALRHFADAIRGHSRTDLGGKLKKAAQDDAVLKSFIDESLEVPDATLPPDVDDVPPSVFKDAIWAEVFDLAVEEPVDVDLDVFLRPVVARIVAAMGWKRRFNVGENRHFPRMVQWLREVQEESTYGEVAGFRLMNRSGSGRVAAYPAGPYALKVRIDGASL